MGRYRSDDSDDEYSRRSRKKKKRRSRSSSSSSQLSHVSDSRSKKSKKKYRRSSRSRSRSVNRKYASRSSRKSRSPSLDKYVSRKRRSDSRSPDRRSSRRSRSPPSKRARSRSKSASSRKRRSLSKSRRSRSASRDRRRKSYSRERSHSGDRTSSVRSSVDRRKVAGQLPGSPRSKGQFMSETAAAEFIEMTLAEQAEERLRQAMKAATSADEKLKARSFLETSAQSLHTDAQNFAASVSAIESDSFVASSFKSSRSTKIKEEAPDSGMSHDDAIFGSLAISGFTLTPDPDNKPIQLDPDSIMHPSLYCDPGEKMERWISRLAQLRRRKLEGDVI
ncbi:hypothetical protein BsWGS_28885 [Bradybaena similaris]